MTRPPRWARVGAALALGAMFLPVAGAVVALVAWALGTPVWEWGELR